MTKSPKNSQTSVEAKKTQNAAAFLLKKNEINDHMSLSKKDWEEMHLIKILFCLLVFPELLSEMLSTVFSNSLDTACVKVVFLFLIEQKVWCISDLLVTLLGSRNSGEISEDSKWDKPRQN